MCPSLIIIVAVSVVVVSTDKVIGTAATPKSNTSTPDQSEISWPTGCQFSYHPQMKPAHIQFHYRDTEKLTEVECFASCRDDTRCGSYSWNTGGINRHCRFYRMTPKMLQRITGIPEETWTMKLQDDAKWNLLIKNCEAYIPETECVYPKSHNRLSPAFKYEIVLVSTTFPYQFNSSDCQSFCDKYPECKSVTFWITPTIANSTINRYHCTLYNTNVTELNETRAAEIYNNTHTDKYPTLITFDRGDCNAGSLTRPQQNMGVGTTELFLRPLPQLPIYLYFLSLTGLPHI